MNDKIKEAWDESINNDDTWDGQVQFLETFAQNIIKECTEVCRQQIEEYKKDVKAAFNHEEKEIYYEGIACADRIRYKINRMFGVKG
ncbi:hypothetical protein UFOVP242_224 [uncultured Caudovirales phage]|uniref:Uncharacterized protein n=1 Tax=uncultured Caudovirales phage TaxID=2100421 RepID=A0A6J7WW83_9CAUD|nr:hypothetical protein UFOVP242_224 [uncultured Caudovirales phage]